MEREMTKKKPKKSTPQPQKEDKSELTLAYLTADQALCLTSILLFPTDGQAMKSLKWGRTKFYRIKAMVKPFKSEYAQEISEDVMFALSLAGKHAVSRYVQLLGRGTLAFQKEVADEIMDRIGITKRAPEEAAVPLVQNIIAQKWGKYEKTQT